MNNPILIQITRCDNQLECLGQWHIAWPAFLSHLKAIGFEWRQATPDDTNATYNVINGLTVGDMAKRYGVAL